MAADLVAGAGRGPGWFIIMVRNFSDGFLKVWVIWLVPSVFAQPRVAAADCGHYVSVAMIHFARA